MRSQLSKYYWLHWLWISLFVVVVDQMTKQAVTASFVYGETKQIFSWFNLVLAHNTGAAGSANFLSC
jgi:signal peptidase II